MFFDDTYPALEQEIIQQFSSNSYDKIVIVSHQENPYSQRPSLILNTPGFTGLPPAALIQQFPELEGAVILSLNFEFAWPKQGVRSNLFANTIEEILFHELIHIGEGHVFDGSSSAVEQGVVNRVNATFRDEFDLLARDFQFYNPSPSLLTKPVKLLSTECFPAFTVSVRRTRPAGDR